MSWLAWTDGGRQEAGQRRPCKMADIGDEELGRKRASRRTKRVRDRAEEEGGKQRHGALIPDGGDRLRSGRETSNLGQGSQGMLCFAN
jgi:hypothetical protein